jgi:hypothetical protein
MSRSKNADGNTAYNGSSSPSRTLAPVELPALAAGDVSALSDGHASGVDFSAYAAYADNDMSTAGGGSTAQYIGESLTGGVGTALYSAPEQAVTRQQAAPPGSGAAGLSYDAKADMFSLGVILFEMCWRPFSTGMERISIIRDLREKATLPSDYASLIPETLAKIILSLVQLDPAKRPAAADLLSSPLLPGKVNIDKSYLREITEALCNPKSEASQEIVSALFRQRVSDEGSRDSALSRSSNYTASADIRLSMDVLCLQPIASIAEKLRLRYFPSGGPPSTDRRKVTVSDSFGGSIPLELTDSLRRKLVVLFERHGAVRLAPPLIALGAPSAAPADVSDADQWPYGTFEVASSRRMKPMAAAVAETFFRLPNDSDTCVRFIDSSGALVSLAAELISPFSKHAGKLGIINSQRYLMDTVYSAGPKSPQGEGMEPSYHAVYDVIRPDIEIATASAAVSAMSDSDRSSYLSELVEARDRNRVLAETEVIDVALESARAVASMLTAASNASPGAGTLTLWLGDLRLMKALFEVCEIPADKCLRALRVMERFFFCSQSRQPYVAASIDEEGLFALLKDAGVSEYSCRALAPFVKVLSQTDRASDPAKVIAELEKVR